MEIDLSRFLAPLPKRKVEAVVLFWQHFTCQRCDHEYHSPKFAGTSAFLRVREHTKVDLEPVMTADVYQELPHEVHVEKRSVNICPNCWPNDDSDEPAGVQLSLNFATPMAVQLRTPTSLSHPYPKR